MLYFIVFIVAICSLIYEVLLSTLSSYLIWNSVVQFTLTIWLFLFWLGIGSFISKFHKNSFKTFLNIELTLWIFWWFSVLIVKSAYILLVDYSILFNLFYFWYVILIWTLTWFEIPLISNILYNKKDKIKQTENEFKNIIWDVFTYDYVGSLIGTFLFPFLLLPYLGLTYTAFIVWLFNILIAFIFIIQKKTKKELLKLKIFYSSLVKILLAILLLITWLIYSNSKFENVWDHFFYKEPIVLKEHSKYQEIVITKRWNDVRLMLNGHLQFLSLDEHRYHNSLWAVANNYTKKLTWEINLLILWWWDGLLARNMIQSLSWKNYKITLVDLDPEMTNLAKTYPLLVKINKWSLNNSNIKIINNDAFKYLLDSKRKYNVIIADFPDPRSVEIAKLYSKEFYEMVQAHLFTWGIFTTQAWNAFFTKESFWSIYKTIETTWQKPFAYHAYLPSFGDWGFIGFKKWWKITQLTWTYISTRFDKDYLVNMNTLKINNLDNEIIINYYLKWRARFSE